jgi:hypothetical protein
MVGQESKPTLARVAAASEPLQISGDSTLGDLEPELQKFIGAPQPEFSSTIVRIRVRISLPTWGRPGCRRERQRQYKRKPARCHPTTVSGFTIANTSDHRGPKLPQCGPEQAIKAA